MAQSLAPDPLLSWNDGVAKTSILRFVARVTGRAGPDYVEPNERIATFDNDGLRGIAAIVFGVLAFMWPGLTLLTLVILYGAFAIVDGVLALAAALGRTVPDVPKWWLVLTGILDIAVGLIAMFWPGITALVLIIFIGAWAIVRGVMEILAAIQLRKEIEGEWLLVLAGVLSVLFGLGVLIFPGTGALALVWLIATYAVAIGIVMIMLALRLRPSQQDVEEHFARRRELKIFGLVVAVFATTAREAAQRLRRQGLLREGLLREEPLRRLFAQQHHHRVSKGCVIAPAA